MQYRAADRCLAAAGFAHQTERFTAPDGEGHIVHRLERLRAEKAHVDVEIFLQAFDPNQRIIIRHPLHRLPA